ncbi:hypothetical protein [Alkalihalobacillus sp. AL-G]|uniref:hypothetical protein n=1 Tax=Alkalihalobacillus sp. AL-G TaxID=2926399 RepID=UPI00272CE45E|nr:hypothetical protein [Alkalihalobacillus sp. AL-G]WLD92066.1 hypothetical protein MOJ78_13620 [Alkalihalobacillus sp. AL-G]
MKKQITIVGILATIIGVSLYIHDNQNDKIKESIIFFPIDPSVAFTSANTSLTLLEEKDEDEYSIRWRTNSTIGKKAYLRQDITLLFEDGRLKDTMSKWMENIDRLEQEKTISSEDSGHFEAISFHHAELHYPNDIIKSAQTMSYDQLYVIDTPLQPLESFETPETFEDENNKKVLDHATAQQLKMVWDSLIQYYNIPIENYFMIPMTDLEIYAKHPLPGITQEKTDKIIGGLWEGIYKNYFLGVKSEGEIESPIGSSLPLLLFHKDMSHLLFLTKTESGKEVQFIQFIDHP